MNLDNARIAFIGAGQMARSLIAGLRARAVLADNLRAATPRGDACAELTREFGVPAFTDNLLAAEGSDIWLFAVKPQMMKSVCSPLAKLAQRQQPLVISIAAGITTAQMNTWLGGGLQIVRAMPNTPALLRAGITGLYATPETSVEKRTAAQRLLAAVGSTVWLEDEALMDVVTALSGSGPAYLYYLAEALQAAGQAQGLPAEIAQALTEQMLLGAARLLNESQESPAQLRKHVTTPNGTTHAAITLLEGEDFTGSFARAIAAATARGRELSAAHD